MQAGSSCWVNLESERGKKTIKVIIRVDFNVPIKDGKITDDNRIKESLKTINYAIEKGAKILLLSHLGRVKTEEDKEKKRDSFWPKIAKNTHWKTT